MKKRIQAFIRSHAAVLVVVLISSTQANAELVTELYAGNGFTQNHNARVNLPTAGITATHEALKFDNAAVLGGRGIYWIDTFSYLGLGIDASHYFGPNQRPQMALTNLCVAGASCSTSPENLKKFNNNVTTLGFDVMFRYPLLKSAQFIQGRLQPYLTVGPAMFITTMTDTDNFIPNGQSSTSTSLGVKAGAGVMLFFTQSVGAFVEYRDSNFKASDQYNNATVVHGITLGKTLGNATFNIQSIIGGISFRC